MRPVRDVGGTATGYYTAGIQVCLREPALSETRALPEEGALGSLPLGATLLDPSLLRLAGDVIDLAGRDDLKHSLNDRVGNRGPSGGLCLRMSQVLVRGVIGARCDNLDAVPCRSVTVTCTDDPASLHFTSLGESKANIRRIDCEFYSLRKPWRVSRSALQKANGGKR